LSDGDISRYDFSNIIARVPKSENSFKKQKTTKLQNMISNQSYKMKTKNKSYKMKSKKKTKATK